MKTPIKGADMLHRMVFSAHERRPGTIEELLGGAFVKKFEALILVSRYPSVVSIIRDLGSTESEPSTWLARERRN